MEELPLNENAASVTILAGWIFILLANPNTLQKLFVAREQRAGYFYAQSLEDCTTST
jgi:hypothetical protein